MADIFISYAKKSEAAIKTIADALTAEGYSVWWDAELPPHRSYSDVIEEEIGKAKAVVVAWSDAADQSQWVRAEADMARNAGKLVQTAIEIGFIPPMPFSQIQVADLSGWRGEGNHTEWAKVRAAVSELVRGAPAGAAPKLKRLRKPLDKPRRSIIGWFGLSLACVIGIGVLVAGGNVLYQSIMSAKWDAESRTYEQEQAAADKKRVASVGWAINVAAHTAVTLRVGDNAECNGAWLSKSYVVTLKSCAIAQGKGSVFAEGQGLIAIPYQLGPAQVRGNLVLLRSVIWSTTEAVPLAQTDPTSGDVVYPGVISRPEGVLISSPACRIFEPDAAGIRKADCVNPAARPGTPLFNKDGAFVGLLDLDGSVLPIEQLRADVIALGVAID